MSNGNGPGRPRCRGVPHAAPTEHSELVARTKCLLDSLRAIRRGHGVTIANLAAAIGTSTSQLSEMERGRALPSIPTFCRWARCLGLDPASILNIVSIEAPPP